MSEDQGHMLAISVVSHRQGAVLWVLLEDIARYCSHHSLHVEITLNLDEELPASVDSFPFSVAIHRNRKPKGFGANHNAAFRRTRGDFFCVLNPDVRLVADPFSPLLADLKEIGSGVVAPKVLSNAGDLQRTARRFPTLWRILQRLFSPAAMEYSFDTGKIYPDWVAGMFMLYPWQAYQMVGGFDERYFLYYEDVDICLRLRLRGYLVCLDPVAVIVHDGAYSSHRSPMYFRHHITSMARFLASSTYRRLRRS